MSPIVRSQVFADVNAAVGDHRSGLQAATLYASRPQLVDGLHSSQIVPTFDHHNATIRTGGGQSNSCQRPDDAVFCAS